MGLLIVIEKYDYRKGLGLVLIRHGGRGTSADDPYPCLLMKMIKRKQDLLWLV